jgi:tetratricopeptide (TPR) repeat protein
VISSLGLVAELQGNLEEAANLHTQHLDLSRSLNDERSVATALGNLAEVIVLLGDFARAEQLYRESLSLWRRLGSANGVLHALNPLALLCLERGEIDPAVPLQREALTLCRDLRNREMLPGTLDGAGRVASVLGRHDLAARLWGAAEAIRELSGQPPDPLPPETRERYLAATRRALGEQHYTSLRQEGRGMTPDRAQEAAIQLLTPPEQANPEQHQREAEQPNHTNR